MKKMILAVLACVAMAMPNEAQAQAYRYNGHAVPTRSASSNFFDDAEMYFGFRIGPAFSSVSCDGTQIKAGSTRGGLNIGLVAGMSLLEEAPLYLESGLYYVQKGGKGTYNLSNIGKVNTTYAANYLEVPLTFKYVYSVDDKVSIQPLLGVYAGLGVGGKIKLNGNVGGQIIKEARSTFSETVDGEDYFRRGDLGLKLGCGAGYDIFYAELYYDLGLANICHDSFDTDKNRSLVLNIGVNF